MDAEYVYIPPPPPPAPVVVETVTDSTSTNSTTDATDATDAAIIADVKADIAVAEASVAATRLIDTAYLMPGNVLNKDFVLKSSITLVTSSIAVGLSVLALQ